MTRPPLGTRLYRWLLRCYPREFRDEYGAEMTRVYRDRAREEPTLRLWPAVLTDLMRTAPREQAAVLLRDARHAWRLWRRTPVLTATALLTLALGVGGNTAVFSAVHAVMLRPLPYPEPDRLVELFEDHRSANAPFVRVSALNYVSWAERARSLEALAAFRGADFNLTDAGDPERVTGSVMTASMFRVLGVSPILGRALSAEDERPGSGRVVLLAEPLWRRRYGADPTIVGRAILVNGEPSHVIGVVPRAFRDVGRAWIGAVNGPQIFAPLTIDTAREHRGNHTLRVVGRLRRGVSIDRARDEMRAIAAALEQEFPSTNRAFGVRVETLYDSMLDDRVRTSLWVLLGTVGIVLVIACANVANVLLARGTSRGRELAVRTALGAGPGRLVRQLLTESVCLGVVSGACGLAAAYLTVQSLRGWLPSTIPRLDEMRVDLVVLAFGLCVSLASGLLFGIVPARRAARVDLLPALTQSGKGLAGASRSFLRNGLVAAQMALATVLLAGAGLLGQSFLRLQLVRLGFEPHGVMTTRITLPRTTYADGARAWGFYERLLQSLEGRPSLAAVGLSTSAPFAPGVRASGRVRDRADRAATPDAGVTAVEHIVSPGYFRTLGIPLLAGRTFGSQDRLDAPRVAIVSESVARQLWPGGAPLGRTLEWNGARQHEVIGVVRDIRGSSDRGARGGGRDQAPRGAVYFPAAQLPQYSMTLLVRVTGEPSGIVPTIREAVRAIDPMQPIAQVRTLSDWLDESDAEARLTTTLTGLFAAVALLLAALGIYGVLSYSVSQRTREIGLRMAMGAARGRVVRLVVRGGMTWALAGIALGLFAALALDRVLGTLLFEVSGRDPLTFAAVAAILTCVALMACYVPAARATRIDPVIALRGN